MSWHLFHKNTFDSTHCAKLDKGFTIAELIIVIAIFALVTSIAMFNQGRLNSNVLISNMAFETALAIREAQVYGIGVRAGGETGAGKDSFSGWFGAHFDLSNPASIIIFNDSNKNDSYDALYSDGNSSEITEAKYQYAFTNQRGNKIVAICTGPLPAGTACQSEIGVQGLDIIFKRPSPEAHFHVTGVPGENLGVSRAYIVVNNVDNSNCRVVIVESTGQIRVENNDVAQKSCVNSN